MMRIMKIMTIVNDEINDVEKGSNVMMMTLM